MFTFSQHIKDTVKKSKSKVNILKSLAGSSWGQDKDTLLLTYKSVCRSTLEYATPVWSTLISDSNWNRLQSVQNQALRVATGCLQMSSTDHLHQETKVLPIREHSTMLTKQYSANCLKPNHPGHKHLDQPKPHRKIKPTYLQYITELKSKKERGLNHKQIIKEVHTESVQKCLNAYQPNRVLQEKPPEVNKLEEKLPRNVRVELSRLRSGFSRRLNSYLNRLDENVNNSCPDCASSPHDAIHLFNCPSNPTNLTVANLWTKPLEVANFLKLEENDDDA